MVLAEGARRLAVCLLLQTMSYGPMENHRHRERDREANKDKQINGVTDEDGRRQRERKENNRYYW